MSGNSIDNSSNAATTLDAIASEGRDATVSGTGGPLSTDEKLAAMKRLQSQAEHRIKLGTQLLKAAEAHTSQSQSVIDQVRSEQNQLRDKLEQDVTQALHHYDDWIGNVEESLTGRLDQIERRIETMAAQSEASEQRLTRMIKRAEALFDQSRSMLENVKTAISRKKAIRPTVNTTKAPAQVELDTEPTMLYGKLMGKLYDREPGDADKSK